MVECRANGKQRLCSKKGYEHMKLAHLTVMVAALILAPVLAHAVPSFARQTGLDCGNCHLSWLELSSVGREFKLGGYTLIKDVKYLRTDGQQQSDRLGHLQHDTCVGVPLRLIKRRRGS